jgi:hypothetical protein
MTKQEFITTHQAMTRSSNRWATAFLVVFFGILLANIPVAGFIDRTKPATWIQVLYGSALFGFLLGNVPLMIWFGRRQRRRFGLQCPSCRKPMVGVIGQIAVASGACGHCGERVFSDEQAA